MGAIIDKLKGVVTTKSYKTRCVESESISVSTTVLTILSWFPNGVPDETEYIDFQLNSGGPVIVSVKEPPTAGNTEGNRSISAGEEFRISGLGDMRAFRTVLATGGAAGTLVAQRYVQASK